MGEQASLLTVSQREYLLDERDPPHENKMRQRLRKRVYTGLRTDGALLFERLAAEERRKIFREWEKDWQDEELEDFPGKMLTWEVATHGHSPDHPDEMQEVERGNFREGITNLLAFLYLGIERGNVGDFEDILESALSKAAHESHRSLDNFEFTAEMTGVHTLTPKTIAERAREGDRNLTFPELGLAVKKGALTPEELDSYLKDLDVDLDLIPEYTASEESGEE